MPLNLSSGGGDFDPYCKYNAKSGRWYFKDGEQEVEVNDPSFVADFDNIKTGWMLFLEGQAPDRVFDESLEQPAPKPSDAHKRGFVLRLFSPQSFKGVVELSATSMHVCNAINDLYTQYEAGKAANAGKLPVIKCEGTTPSKDKFGTNYKPNMRIDSWIERPQEFDSPRASNDAESAPQPAASSVSEF